MDEKKFGMDHLRPCWCVDDVMYLFDVTQEQAERFLQDNEGHIQDNLIERGWEVLKDLGHMSGLKEKQEDVGPTKTLTATVTWNQTFEIEIPDGMSQDDAQDAIIERAEELRESVPNKPIITSCSDVDLED